MKWVTGKRPLSCKFTSTSGPPATQELRLAGILKFFQFLLLFVLGSLVSKDNIHAFCSYLYFVLIVYF